MTNHSLDHESEGLTKFEAIATSFHKEHVTQSSTTVIKEKLPHINLISITIFIQAFRLVTKQIFKKIKCKDTKAVRSISHNSEQYREQ
jgi:hypothetical protein